MKLLDISWKSPALSFLWSLPPYFEASIHTFESHSQEGNLDDLKGKLDFCSCIPEVHHLAKLGQKKN